MIRSLVLSIVTLAVAACNTLAQVIVIDAGHGVELSCQNCDRPDEEVLTVMDVTWKLRDTIQAHCNWSVYLTRPDNACGSCPTLTQRETMSNSWGADRFISIHANAGGGTGTETFWCDLSASSNADAQAFATEVQNQMVTYGQWTSRRVVEDNSYLGYHLGVLNNNNAIGCLNEIGFYDNPSDLTKLQSAYWQGQFAKAYYIALQNDMNTTCSGGIPPPANDNCANAIALTPNTTCTNTQGTVAAATAGGLAKPSCDVFVTPTLKDVWFKFQATSTTHDIQVSPSASFDVVIALYSTCSSGELDCADNGNVGITEAINAAGLTIGNIYYIRVYDYGSVDPTTPTFDICVTGQAPPTLPDLDITTGSVQPTVVLAGDSVTINYTIINTTNTMVTVNTETGYYLIPVTQVCPTNIPANNFNGGTLTVSEISDGAETEIHTVIVPASTVVGNYYLVVAADQLNDLTENNELNNIFCIPLSITSLILVSGNVHTETGSPVNTVTVNTDCAVSSFETASDGDYDFAMTLGSSCSITPTKSNDVDRINGISTLDILFIQRHLLGNVLLSSPYKIIAADVDVSGSVSTLDIVRIRQLILGWTNYFPGGRLWRFVPDDYVFANPQVPFPHDTSRYYSNMSPLSEEDFIAVKLGDVNASWNPNVAKAAISSEVAPTFIIDSVATPEGSQVLVPVRVVNFDNIVAMQGTISFDTAILTFDALLNYGLSGMGPANFGTNHASGGKITYSWDDATLSGVTLADGSDIFTIRFNVIGVAGQNSPVIFFNNPLMQEVVDVGFNVVNAIYMDGNVMIEDTSTQGIQTVIQATSLKIFPNPNSGAFNVELQLDSPTEIQIIIFNTLGQKISGTAPETAFGNYSRSFDLSHDPAGNYMISVIVGADRVNIVIEKTGNPK